MVSCLLGYPLFVSSFPAVFFFLPQHDVEALLCFLRAGCPKGFYGKQCNKKCNCANNGRCHRTYGACLCDPGLYGRFCHLRESRSHHGHVAVCAPVLVSNHSSVCPHPPCSFLPQRVLSGPSAQAAPRSAGASNRTRWSVTAATAPVSVSQATRATHARKVSKLSQRLNTPHEHLLHAFSQRCWSRPPTLMHSRTKKRERTV